MDRRNDRESARRMAAGARLDADAALRLAENVSDDAARMYLNAASDLLRQAADRLSSAAAL